MVYRVNISFKNVGESGYVTVYGYAKSIEKKFSKSEKLYLIKDEKDDVSFYFPDVDLYASNLSFRAFCEP